MLVGAEKILQNLLHDFQEMNLNIFIYNPYYPKSVATKDKYLKRQKQTMSSKDANIIFIIKFSIKQN